MNKQKMPYQQTGQCSPKRTTALRLSYANCLALTALSIILTLLPLSNVSAQILPKLLQEVAPPPGGLPAVVTGLGVDSGISIATPAVGGKPHDSSPEPLDMISARGFIGEAFDIKSRDGAPLSVYHMVNPLADQKTLNRFPVLVAHGLSGDSSQLLSNSAESKPRKPTIGTLSIDVGDISLPFMLSNNNFDVWLVDARGTNLKNHKISTEFDFFEANKFWNYTLDEQAQLDLASVIDFVLAQTDSPKLHYLSYSESTFFMFALLTSQPQYQEKMVSAVTIAPVAYVTHIRGSLLPLLIAASTMPDQINGNYIPPAISDTVGVGIRKICTTKWAGSTICTIASRGLAGQGESQDDFSTLYSTAFKSTSIKSLKHFYQLHIQKRFGMYDYGLLGNIRAYGQPTPPNYNLANIKLPTLILVRGGTDFLSTPEDQEILLSQLGVRPYMDIRLPTFNHLDFFIGTKALFQVNVPVVRTMLEILKLNCPTEDVTRDMTAFVKTYKPSDVRMPSANNKVVIQSNLLPNLLDGLQQTKEDVTSRLRNLPQEPMKMLKGFGHQFKDLSLNGLSLSNLHPLARLI